ncbi:MAG: type II toxin-antitoxin system VapC family toxin [Chloroflexi bacterium CFX2]|nr:type II toxin-antitoxin system VapC family toxin [Chloroflexi bacterium CFX2]
MSGKYLLDTNIVIALFANDAAVVESLSKAEEIFVPSVVIGELFYGAHKSARAKDNLARIDEFASSNLVLGCDTETARIYGDVKNTLRIKGHPIPENDIWISAVAIQHNLTLVSRDAHFNEIENLKVVVW